MTIGTNGDDNDFGQSKAAARAKTGLVASASLATAKFQGQTHVKTKISEEMTMETINKVLNKQFNMQTGPTFEEIQSKLEHLNRLFAVFEGPEYREYIHFAVEWEKLGRELKALQSTIRERFAETPASKANQLLRRLVKKS